MSDSRMKARLMLALRNRSCDVVHDHVRVHVAQNQIAADEAILQLFGKLGKIEEQARRGDRERCGGGIGGIDAQEDARWRLVLLQSKPDLLPLRTAELRRQELTNQVRRLLREDVARTRPGARGAEAPRQALLMLEDRGGVALRRERRQVV